MISRSEKQWLWGIVLAGLMLRLWAINYGLPREHFTDEEFFVPPALTVAGGSFNPGWFGEAQPMIYLTGAVYKIVAANLNLVNHSHLTPAQLFPAHVTAFYVAGRVVAAIGGTVMILAAWWLGRRWSTTAGLLAAAGVAGNFFLVDHSHIIRPDIWQAACLLFGVAMIDALVNNPREKRWYLAAGIFFGLAMTMKVTSVTMLTFLPVLLLDLWRRGQWHGKLWLASAGSALATAMVTAPYYFLKPYETIKDIGYELLQDHSLHNDFGFWRTLWHYLGQTLPWQIGTALLLGLVAAGAWWCFKGWRRSTPARQTTAAVIILATLGYLLGLSMTHQYWDRWMIPVTGLLSVVTGIALAEWWNSRARRWIVLTTLAVILAAPVVRLVRTMASYHQPPTSAIARQWITSHIPTGDTLATEPYGPVSSADGYDVVEVPHLAYHSDAFYQQQHVSYLISSGGVYGVLQRSAARFGPASKYAVAVTRYQQLIRDHPQLFSIGDDPRQTVSTLVHSSDWNVLAHPGLRYQRGPAVTMYRWATAQP